MQRHCRCDPGNLPEVPSVASIRHRDHLYSCDVRRTLRGLWKVDLALTLAVAIALCVVWNQGPNHMGNDSPQSNLQIALTGASTFYRTNQDSYVGIGGGSQLPGGVSSISQIVFGVTFVSGDKAATGTNTISLLAPSSSQVVMTEYRSETQTCWGVLNVTATQTRPYFPAYPSTAKVGTYYFRGTSSASTNCAAAKLVPTALNRTGFPAG
jgi:hypothetical protein